MYFRPRPRPAQRTAQATAWDAPVAGLIANRSLAVPSRGLLDKRQAPGAMVLENWFPTGRGITIRRGSAVEATLPGAPDVEEMFSYHLGQQEELFAAAPNAIYDITVPTLPVAVFDGLTSGDWTVVQFATAGGTFLVAVNGHDQMLIYDGTYWAPIGNTNLYTLRYDTGTGPFVVGRTVTGSTSGATGVIRAVIGTTSSGTLIIDTVDQDPTPFQDNEALTTTPAGGAALVDGTAALHLAGITGVDTSTLNFVWVYKNRLFFTQNDTLDVWYLPIDAIGGEAHYFPLGGVFTHGSEVLFGSSWSIEAADVDSRCVFVSTGDDEGAEAAVYAGTDPDDPDQWGQVGVYRIGKPLGKRAHLRAGGDLLIAMDLGLIPLSVAISRDFATLSQAAVSFPIEDRWAKEVAKRTLGEWKMTSWPTGRMHIVMLPGHPPVWLVLNSRTGAWTTFTGWQAHCVKTFEGKLYFGSDDGKVVQAGVGGFDQGLPYSATVVPLFEDLKAPANLKVPTLARAVLRGKVSIRSTLAMLHDYVIKRPPAPPASPTAVGVIWGGTAKWGDGVSKWGAQTMEITVQDWVSVSGEGYALAPILVITSGANVPLDTELVRIDGLYLTAEVVT